MNFFIIALQIKEELFDRPKPKFQVKVEADTGSSEESEYSFVHSQIDIKEEFKSEPIVSDEQQPLNPVEKQQFFDENPQKQPLNPVKKQGLVDERQLLDSLMKGSLVDVTPPNVPRHVRVPQMPAVVRNQIILLKPIFKRVGNNVEPNMTPAPRSNVASSAASFAIISTKPKTGSEIYKDLRQGLSAAELNSKIQKVIDSFGT